jgi:hypothetical protein
MAASRSDELPTPTNNGDLARKVNLTIVTDPEKQPVVEKPEMTAWYVWGGRALAIIFGLGCGACGAAALLLNGYAVSSALALGGFSFVSNFFMTQGDVSTVMWEGFDGLFRKDDEPGSAYLSESKQRYVKIGIFLAVTFGLTMAALTYKAVLKLATVAFFAPIAPALPAIIPVLMVVTLIIQSALMTKGFTDIIRIDNLWDKTKNWLDDTFRKRHANDLNKSKLLFVTERVAMAALASCMLPVVLLILWGKTETLASCAKGLAEMVQTIPNATPAIAHGVSFVVAQVLAFVAQLPFVAKVTITPLLAGFTREKTAQQAVEKPKATFWGNVVKIVKPIGIVISSLLNSACMAAIAMQGKEHDLATTLGGVGAFTDGFVSSSVNALISGDKKKAPATHGSTKGIHNGLGSKPELDEVDEHKQTPPSRKIKTEKPEPASSLTYDQSPASSSLRRQQR